VEKLSQTTSPKQAGDRRLSGACTTSSIENRLAEDESDSACELRDAMTQVFEPADNNLPELRPDFFEDSN
jgi:hypothetical protein